MSFARLPEVVFCRKDRVSVALGIRPVRSSFTRRKNSESSLRVATGPPALAAMSLSIRGDKRSAAHPDRTGSKIQMKMIRRISLSTRVRAPSFNRPRVGYFFSPSVSSGAGCPSLASGFSSTSGAGFGSSPFLAASSLARNFFGSSLNSSKQPSQQNFTVTPL